MMIQIDKDYVVALRRQLHQYPETDFDLPKTVALVKGELEKLGIPYTEKYGKGSVIGYINPDKDTFTIGIRADMDALKIQEKNTFEYASKIDGKMHACGHDAHTATLLGVAKFLKSIEADLACRVKLIFQPSEEGVESGSRMLVDAGVLQDVDVIIGAHIENTIDSGKLAVCPGFSQASSRTFTIEVFGKSAHAAAPETGIDSMAAAVKLYSRLKERVEALGADKKKYIYHVGKFHSGTAQNIISDYTCLVGTVRALDNKIDLAIASVIDEQAVAVEKETGTDIKVTYNLKATSVYNNPYLASLVVDAIKDTVGEENVAPMPQKLGSEDFSAYGDKIPAVLFRIGTKNEAKGLVNIPHNDDFELDEDALPFGASTFIQFVLNNQYGIDKQKLLDADER
ncbi:MAG: amidohydrolase [Clostridia bacterium]|nr:amidohydrolase [Clostridia bacterium]